MATSTIPRPLERTSWRTSKGKVALVVGASTEVGEAIAVRLASHGYKTYGTVRGAERMLALESAGGRPIQLDLADPASLDACVSTITSENGGVDVLVNVAAAELCGSVEDVPLADVRAIFEANLFGGAAIIQKISSRMRAKRAGTIISVSSVSQVVAQPNRAWHNASRFALEAFSASLRQELHPFGIEVVLLRVKAHFVKSQAELNATPSPSVQAMDARARAVSVMVAPALVADVVDRVLTSLRPRAVYTVPRRAKFLSALLWIGASARLRYAFLCRLMGYQG